MCPNDNNAAAFHLIGAKPATLRVQKYAFCRKKVCICMQEIASPL